jgi:benzodiazapine receptor
MRNPISLVLFLVLVVGGGLLVGFVAMPDSWYQTLVKPSFNPPNWLFGPVWTILYVLIAIAGWRIWNVDRAGGANLLWWAQLALNFMWSPAFFGLHMIGFALLIVLLMLATILAFIVAAWRQDRVAALLFVPYAAWVSFASLLNAAIWRLN